MGIQEIPGLLIPTVEGGLLCYRELSREAARRRVECPQVLSVSLSSDTATRIVAWMRAGDYQTVADTIVSSMERLRAAGATFAAMTANLTHMAFAEIHARSPLPLISIVDAVARHAAQRGFRTVGLLGTQAIMESDLYPRALAQAQIDVIVPDAEDRGLVNHTIFAELLAGIVTPENRTRMERVAASLQARGAQALALCCTELGLVLDDKPELPTLDSTRLLAHAVLDRCLARV